MNKFWEKLEEGNAHLIPFAIIGLLFVIVVELFFTTFSEHHHAAIAILDGFIIAVFVVDLIFLAIKAKSTKYFFKSYWLDIVAIFPFGIVFNFFTKFYRALIATQRVVVGQGILRQGLEARKGVSALARSGRAARVIRIVARSVRVITKSKLFTHIEAKHHLAKRNMKKGKNDRKDPVKRRKSSRKKK